MPRMYKRCYINARDRSRRADGTLPSVPRDAYWSWGLGESLMVVIPSLDIVAARAGNRWRTGAWTANYAVLDQFITPIAKSVPPPP